MWLTFCLLTQFAGAPGWYRQNGIALGRLWLPAELGELGPPRAWCPPWLCCCCCSYWSSPFSFYSATVCKTANSVAALQWFCFAAAVSFLVLWPPVTSTLRCQLAQAHRHAKRYQLAPTDLTSRIVDFSSWNKFFEPPNIARKNYQLILTVRLFKT